MKKSQITIMFALAAITFAGCKSSTTIFDPATTHTGIRQEGNVSSEEMRNVTVAAVESAMINPRFIQFLQQYQQEKNDPNARPVVKLDRTVNDTDDPDLNVGEITDMLNEALINAGKVDVTLAEGADRTAAIAASRDLENDDNFDQSTVAQRGTLQAARLLLRPKVTSTVVSDGDRRVVVRTFVMDMVDVRTGIVMWRFTKQLGFIRERGLFGW